MEAIEAASRYQLQNVKADLSEGSDLDKKAQLLLGSFKGGIGGSDGARSIARIRKVVFVPKHVADDFLAQLHAAALLTDSSVSTKPDVCT